jgi:hypothetical protein
MQEVARAPDLTAQIVKELYIALREYNTTEEVAQRTQ